MTKLSVSSTEAGLADAADIVAAEIDQHQVFGAFFRIGEQFLFEREVFFARGAARPGASDRAQHDAALLQTHQDFG